MALHRKQRGSVDVSPQYVRIPASRANSGQGSGYSLHEPQPHARRVYARRYVAGDRPRKISSLQLRACFVLCVLLYFGAIYFADDIATLGRVVGSGEKNSKSFFVHSLQPRGRGNVRVGRAVGAKRAEATLLPTQTDGLANDMVETEQDNPPLETETPYSRVEPEPTAEPLDAKATLMVATSPGKHPIEEGGLEGGVHPDDKGDGDEASATPATATGGGGDGGASRLKQSDAEHQYVSHQHERETASHPSDDHRHGHDKHEGTAMPAASPARAEKHVRGAATGNTKQADSLPRVVTRKPDDAGAGKNQQINPQELRAHPHEKTRI